MNAQREYDVADRPVVRIVFWDDSGAPVNPSTVKIITKNPSSGTETVYTTPDASITNPETGEFRFKFPAAITTPGTWLVRGLGTAGTHTGDETPLVVRQSGFTTPIP